MRLPRLQCIAASVCVAALARAATFDERVEALFRPPVGEHVALSPDGRRVAYTTSTDIAPAIALLTVEPPGAKPIFVSLRDSAAPVPVPAGTPPPPPPTLRFLRWATADRLVFAPPERIVPLPPLTDAHGRSAPNPDGPTIIAPVMTVGADGKRVATLVDARDFQETPADARQSLADLLRTPQELAATRRDPVRWRMPHLDILGFLPPARDQLILGTRGAYSIPMQHLVDLRTGHVREFGREWPAPPAEPQIYDWNRHQVVGERGASPRPATVWQDPELARAQQELARKFPRRLVELLDWSDTRAEVLVRVTGGSDPGRVFVYRRTEDLAVEIFRRAPWLEAADLYPSRAFDFTAPDGATLGGYLVGPAKPRVTPPPLVVVFSSDPPDRSQPAFDPEAQLLADLGFAVARLGPRPAARASADDALAAIAWLTAEKLALPFDRRRVAVVGHGVGGDLAIRALRLRPAEFHCAIAVGTPVDPAGDDAPVPGHATPPAAAVLLLSEPERSPAALAAAYRKIGDFLHAHLAAPASPSAPSGSAGLAKESP